MKKSQMPQADEVGRCSCFSNFTKTGELHYFLDEERAEQESQEPAGSRQLLEPAVGGDAHLL